jgi:hypothetical protein
MPSEDLQNTHLDQKEQQAEIEGATYPIQDGREEYQHDYEGGTYRAVSTEDTRSSMTIQHRPTASQPPTEDDFDQGKYPSCK